MSAKSRTLSDFLMVYLKVVKIMREKEITVWKRRGKQLVHNKHTSSTFLFPTIIVPSAENVKLTLYLFSIIIDTGEYISRSPTAYKRLWFLFIFYLHSTSYSILYSCSNLECIDSKRSLVHLKIDQNAELHLYDRLVTRSTGLRIKK